MSTLSLPHIRLDDDGSAWIYDKKSKVTEFVAEKFANGWSTEEVHFQHPQFSLAQIHAAMAYYYDHQAEMDSEMERQYQTKDFVQRRAGAGASPFVQR